MATLTFTYDHSRDPMNPAQLADQIATSLALTTLPAVDINPTQIIVAHPNVTSANTAAIQSLINAYVFDAVWADGVEGSLKQKATTALQTNIDALALPDPTDANTTYLTHAPVPAGTLTTIQLSAIVRLLSDQVDALTRQNNALVSQSRALTRQNTTLIRLATNRIDSTSGT